MDDPALVVFGGLFVAGYAVVTTLARLSIAEPLGLPYPFWFGVVAFLAILLLLFGLA